MSADLLNASNTTNSSQAAIATLVQQLAAQLSQRQWRLALAESCTGGLIAAHCTALAGSSHWFEAGFVTYSNAAKTAQLGVPAALITEHGAVSEPVAAAMAQGALLCSGATIAASVTGVAGPAGGTPAKPVGTVCFAWALGNKVITVTQQFQGDRAAVREQAVLHALRQMIA